jgi:hypothetical protein
VGLQLNPDLGNSLSRCDTIPQPDPANPHAPPFTIHSLFLLLRTEGADEKIAEGLPAVIGEEAGSGAGKRI